MKKNILVDLKALKNPYCGLGQFSKYLGVELSKYDAFDLTYLLPHKTKKLFENVKFVRTYFWKKDKINKYLKYAIPQKRYDLWHMTEQSSPYLPIHDNTPMILTIHDLNFLREKSELKIQKHLKVMQDRIDRSEIITTISNFAASEIKHHLNTQDKEIKVIYNGLNINNTTIQKPDFKHINKPYLFTIGQVFEKKNFHVLVDFVKNTDLNLVIAGQKQTAYAKMIQDKIDKLNLGNRIILAGPITESEKNWLYQHCEAFAFPSLTEGFGLPVIEAMHYGKPVFLANATSLPEVAGEFGFYWDDFSPQNMLEVFQKGMQYYQATPSFKEGLIARAHEFSWENAAKEYHKIYENILR